MRKIIENTIKIRMLESDEVCPGECSVDA